jgi:hypothetical protein
MCSVDQPDHRLGAYAVSIQENAHRSEGRRCGLLERNNGNGI